MATTDVAPVVIVAPVWTRDKLIALRPILTKILSDKFGIKDSRVKELVDDRSIRQFAIAMTNKTVAPHRDMNYDIYEYLGDGIVNDVIAYQIVDRFPALEVGWLTQVKHNLMSAKFLAKVAFDMGLDKIVKFDPSDTRLSDLMNVRKMYSDLVESLCGFVRKMMHERGYTVGTGTQVCSNMLSKYVSEEPISLDYLSVFGPVTVFKETCDMYARTPDQYGKGWPMDPRTRMLMPPPQEMRVVTPEWEFRRGATIKEFEEEAYDPESKMNRMKFSFQVFGWFGKRAGGGYQQIGSASGFLKDEVKQDVCMQALETLKKRGYPWADRKPY